MGDSYARRAAKEGPLPKVDDESELVGEDERNPPTAGERATEEYVTIPSPGAGSFPVPHVSDKPDGEQAPAEQEAQR